jgi:hypothetical protein
MKLKAASIGLLASAMVCAPLSEASAHGFRHHGHWLLFAPFEAVGAVVAGVAEIATAPIVLLADAVDGPGYDHRGGYYERHGDYYGRGAPYGPAQEQSLGLDRFWIVQMNLGNHAANRGR